MPKPATENRHGDIRTSTLMEIRKRYPDVLRRSDRLAEIRICTNILQITLDQHKAGYRHVNAAAVYHAAANLAATVIALAEHGTDGYPYASQIPTGQTELNLK